MKQHITVEQWNELSEKLKGKLRSWSELHGYEYPGTFLISIGQMIEFIDEKSEATFSIGKHYHNWCSLLKKHYVKRELCDSLWEIIKNLLEDEKMATERKR